MKSEIKEFNLLKEYLNVYIQLIPYCIEFGGKRIHKQHLPTFDYFKKYYYNKDYSFVIPHFKECFLISKKNELIKNYTHGIKTKNGIGYRYYNYYMGCKYFTNNNITGNYTVENKYINNFLKLNSLQYEK